MVKSQNSCSCQNKQLQYFWQCLKALVILAPKPKAWLCKFNDIVPTSLLTNWFLPLPNICNFNERGTHLGLGHGTVSYWPTNKLMKSHFPPAPKQIGPGLFEHIMRPQNALYSLTWNWVSNPFWLVVMFLLDRRSIAFLIEAAGICVLPHIRDSSTASWRNAYCS